LAQGSRLRPRRTNANYGSRFPYVPEFRINAVRVVRSDGVSPESSGIEAVQERGYESRAPYAPAGAGSERFLRRRFLWCPGRAVSAFSSDQASVSSVTLTRDERISHA